MSVYEKTFAYSCLEHMQRFFYLLFLPLKGRLYVCFTVQAVQVSAVRESAERPVQEPAERLV